MTDADRRIQAMIHAARDKRWPGTDHHHRVDQFLKEQRMHHAPKLNRTTIALIAAGILGGGAVSAAVTHQVLTHRARIVAEDGTVYDVELATTPDGAQGTFVTDDGTTYGISMVEDEDRKEVSVEIDSANGGESTVTIGDVSPRVLVAPGQTASIKIETLKTDEEGATEKDDAEDPSAGG